MPNVGNTIGPNAEKTTRAQHRKEKAGPTTEKQKTHIGPSADKTIGATAFKTMGPGILKTIGPRRWKQNWAESVEVDMSEHKLVGALAGSRNIPSQNLEEI